MEVVMKVSPSFGLIGAEEFDEDANEPGGDQP